MVTDKMKELEAARARLADLEKSLASELNKELAGLPAKFGFDNVEAFVTAVRAAGGVRRGRPPGSGKKSGVATETGKKKRRPRAVITDETRAELKQLVEAGKTGAEIAKALDISVPSVHNIKKALGLVKKKK